MVGYIIFHPFLKPCFSGFLEKPTAAKMRWSPEILVTPPEMFLTKCSDPKNDAKFWGRRYIETKRHHFGYLIYLENVVYHFFRQLWLFLGVNLMGINSNLFSRYVRFRGCKPGRVSIYFVTWIWTHDSECMSVIFIQIRAKDTHILSGRYFG